MTMPHSEAGDNGGRCECCDRKGSEYLPQSTYPVYLGGYAGGPVRGTMWLCDECRSVIEEQDRGHTLGKGPRTPEFRARLDAIKASPIRKRLAD